VRILHNSNNLSWLLVRTRVTLTVFELSPQPHAILSKESLACLLFAQELLETLTWGGQLFWDDPFAQ
jgi:hypothetical protein